jgi:hypothetical protein
VFAAQELYCAIQLKAEVIMCLSSAQAKEFYQRLKQEQRQRQAGGMAKHQQEVLVPTIDVRKAQATKEKDRVRIFTKIEDTIGMKAFNAQLQVFMEAALQEEARAALLSAEAGSMHGKGGAAGGSDAARGDGAATTSDGEASRGDGKAAASSDGQAAGGCGGIESGDVGAWCEARCGIGAAMKNTTPLEHAGIKSQLRGKTKAMPSRGTPKPRLYWRYQQPAGAMMSGRSVPRGRA